MNNGKRLICACASGFLGDTCQTIGIEEITLFVCVRTLLTYSSSSQVGHKASISCLHSQRSRARSCASPQERFNSDSSDVIVFLQVVFGLPGFRLQVGSISIRLLESAAGPCGECGLAIT